MAGDRTIALLDLCRWAIVWSHSFCPANWARICSVQRLWRLHALHRDWCCGYRPVTAAWDRSGAWPSVGHVHREQAVDAFIEVIRGVPLIVWLFTASLLLNYFLPPGTNFDLMLRVIIMVTLFSAAYIAEVVRGGLAALPSGQYEGADSLGLDYWQSMRLIILPQALKISIPGIVNTFIGLFKDTTLVVFIGLLDPIGLTTPIRSSTDWNGIYWELYVFIGLMFFIFCFSMGRYSLYLERKLQREHR